MTRRLGIFGGTFDPAHNGHLVLASESVKQLNLNAIIWVLTPNPPHKSNQLISPWGVRFDMLRIAIDNRGPFTLSRVEIDRPGPHYAVETLRLLKSQYPGDSMIYLMGEDSLRDLPSWHQPNALVKICDSLGIMRRPDTDLSIETVEAEIPGIREKLEFIQVPLIDVSSSKIREQIRSGGGCPDGLDPDVFKIIQRHDLYR
ncbi:MAG: nicotinate (nicotinamide) nucleotide adenylyltransferase [Chloroflexi bacterium]|nr:nicotinate (nicotinamide) nucleotide adenylyltransferase [Chloroflexota bacterium]